MRPTAAAFRPLTHRITTGAAITHVHNPSVPQARGILTLKDHVVRLFLEAAIFASLSNTVFFSISRRRQHEAVVVVVLSSRTGTVLSS